MHLQPDRESKHRFQVDEYFCKEIKVMGGGGALSFYWS